MSNPQSSLDALNAATSTAPVTNSVEAPARKRASKAPATDVKTTDVVGTSQEVVQDDVVLVEAIVAETHIVGLLHEPRLGRTVSDQPTYYIGQSGAIRVPGATREAGQPSEVLGLLAYPDRKVTVRLGFGPNADKKAALKGANGVMLSPESTMFDWFAFGLGTGSVIEVTGYRQEARPNTDSQGRTWENINFVVTGVKLMSPPRMPVSHLLASNVTEAEAQNHGLPGTPAK